MFRSSRLMLAAALGGLMIAVSAPAAAQQGPLPVTVAKPLIKKIVEWDEYTGRFEAQKRVEIRARVSGFLDSIHFKEGQLVEKGQLLFIIDPRPFQAELAAAKATLEGAQSKFKLAERELKRAETLVKRGHTSREVLDQRRAERETTRTDVLAARAQVRIAELDLEFTHVKAPIAGRVSDARIDAGNLVAGGSSQATLLTTLVSIDPILFTFTASEAEFLKYARLHQTGQRSYSREKDKPVSLRLMDEDEFKYAGRMNFVDNELSPETATIRAQARFDNPDGFLTPGVFGRLRVAGSEEYEALLIPDSAIVSDQNRKIVFLVDAKGKVAASPVDLGPLHEGLRVVRGGVGENDLVIVQGLQRGRPGATVAPREKILQPDGSLKPKSGS
ncbi:MAG: efflux RND transporter periplasmic adaptor subunit [Magnetovibrio sp.]|nr:efflux RND transporter periplasmic adaptor subunit [Magnetovibrio sp.]